MVIFLFICTLQYGKGGYKFIFFKHNKSFKINNKFITNNIMKSFNQAVRYVLYCNNFIGNIQFLLESPKVVGLLKRAFTKNLSLKISVQTLQIIEKIVL